MLETFRNFSKSKLGVGIVLGFLAILMLAFGLGDVMNNGGFGGLSSGSQVAKVGSEKITADALQSSAQTALENAREQNPKLTMRTLLAGGRINEILDSLVDRAALNVWGAKNDIVASDRLIGSELAKIGAFRGIDGKFSEAAYRGVLAQRGLSDAQVRGDIAASLIARQVLVPAAFGASFPQSMTQRYAELLKEKRSGEVLLLPSVAFAGQVAPSDAALATYYKANSANYQRPERRTIRYATFGDAALKTVPAPTEAEIAARYKADAAQYAASQSRSVTQLVLPTEAAAKAVLAEVQRGATLENAARGKGLAAVKFVDLTREALTAQSAKAVADATFAAQRGTIAGPVRSGLGWHLMRIDTVNDRAARTLDQARGAITTALAAEKRRKALSDFTAEIEDEFDNGGSLSDIAKQLGLTLTQTEPLTADGAVYGKADGRAPAELGRVVSTAFAMEREQQPQIAEIEAGKTFIVFDVGSIAPASPAPLADIRDLVSADYARQQGAAAARKAADRVLAAAKQGKTLAQGAATLGVRLPAIDNLAMTREQLAAMRDVPAPLRLMFAMAAGTTKIYPAPRNVGFYVVRLASIETGKIAANDPELAAAKRELGTMAGREYAEALRVAIRNEVGVTRDDAAIARLVQTLNGSN